MANIKPNPAVEKARVKMNIANLTATIERQKFENIEMEDRRVKNDENIAASYTSIESLKVKLADLDKANPEGKK